MNTNKKTIYYYLILLVSPIIGVYLAIRNLSWPKRKGVLIMAITLFGATIFLSEVDDGYRLRQVLYDHYIGLSPSDWFYELKQILQFETVEGLKGDVYSHFFSYLIGHILGIPSQYFLFISFVFAYFYINSIADILQWDKKESKSLLFWCIIIVFVTYRSIDSIQSVRTWTGGWVLFYSVYRYHLTKKIKYLWLMLAAPLIHVAYFVIALPAYCIIFFKWLSPRVFIPLYILSFIITVNPSAIVGQLQTTELGASKIDGYYNENVKEGTVLDQYESTNFYKKYGKGWGLANAPHFAAITIIIFGLFSVKRMTDLELGLFSTGILMATVANLGDFVPVFYNRTMVNAGIYILATLSILLIRGELLNAKGIHLIYRKLALWAVFAMFIPYLLFFASNMTRYTSIFMLVGTPAGFFAEINLSIRQLVDILLL